MNPLPRKYFMRYEVRMKQLISAFKKNMPYVPVKSKKTSKIEWRNLQERPRWK